MNSTVPRRILVVDDDPDAAWALSTMLRQQFDCEVRTAYGGAEAIDQASGMRPQAIVMDISMPRVDGIEAARILRRLFAAEERPRLIALTGLDAAVYPNPVLDAAFDRCLRKPLQFDELVRALRES